MSSRQHSQSSTNSSYQPSSPPDTPTTGSQILESEPLNASGKFRQSPTPTPNETDDLMSSGLSKNQTAAPLSTGIRLMTSSEDLSARSRYPTAAAMREASSPTPTVSSPLNPNLFSPLITPRAGSAMSQLPPPRPLSQIKRVPSEDAIALSRPPRSPSNTTGDSGRGSMLLYRLAGADETGALVPPSAFHKRRNRDSFGSTSADSTYSLSTDSKYPSGFASRGGLVPYAFDPLGSDDIEEHDALHDGPEPKKSHGIGGRGFLNLSVLFLIILALVTLFMGYPIVTHFENNARRLALISGNTQNPLPIPGNFTMPPLIDPETPVEARTRVGTDNQNYELVFSDEFNTDNRTFYPGDDPYWEAVDLWYGATMDLEWYDPGQITTRNGKLVIRIDEGPGAGAGSGGAHNLSFRSGMLQSWNKFCFTGGYIEVSLTLPGPTSSTAGYWPGVWTMGNLGRPGYLATTDGTWPYTYNTCDVGTFPNQTRKDGSGPLAALHSDFSKPKYNYELSWLPGQRLSACTCPGEDHPGPSPNVGRGAPEIDVLEAERNKRTSIGGTVSQSAQFAPFTHDYGYINTTGSFDITDLSLTYPNDYKGSAIQQAVSALTIIPDDMFEGSGQVFTVFGFEYNSDPSTPEEGYIQWISNNKKSVRMDASAVPADPEANGGSGVGQRLVPVEPMSIILNCGISHNWQTVDLSTMEFPSEMLIDYVRVYQRSGKTNIGCNPPNFPTTDYINRHMDAYTNINMTKWPYPRPKNSQYDGC